MFGLAVWTALVLLLIPVARFRAVSRGEVTVADFKLGESSAVPFAVSIPNRNYMNLLEAPALFYVVCLTLYVSATSSISNLSCLGLRGAACGTQRHSSDLQQSNSSHVGVRRE